MGLLCNGTIINISMHPVNMPADARPAMDLPTMKTVEVGAAPHMAEPISKTTMDTRNVLSNDFSVSGCRMAVIGKKQAG